MTALSGDFETDLPVPAALSACTEAFEALGWPIEAVDAERIISYAASRDGQRARRIEVLLSRTANGTDVRIIGTDANATSADELIAELNRARDSIKAAIERADEPAGQGSALSRVPLFDQRPQEAQIVTAIIVPAVFGAVAGIFLGISAAAYWLIQLVALVGAVLAGLEHRNGREGARRGLVGGTLYGIFLLLAHAVIGTSATVKLPNFEPILVVFTALFGALGSGLGGRLRRTAMEREGVR
jgi:hypothetical protein